MHFTPFPLLATNRLILRKLRNEDETRIFQLRSDERVMKYVDRPVTRTKGQARDFIHKMNDGIGKDKWIYWAISQKEEDNLIGTICLWNFDRDVDKAEVGFELLPDFQGKGFMQEALAEVLQYGFGVLHLKSIEAVTHEDNIPSISLLKRNQFEFIKALVADKSQTYEMHLFMLHALAD